MTELKRAVPKPGKSIYAQVAFDALTEAGKALNYRVIVKRKLPELHSYWAKAGVSIPVRIEDALRRSLSDKKEFVALGEGMYDLHSRHPHLTPGSCRKRAKKPKPEAVKDTEVIPVKQRLTNADMMRILIAAKNLVARGIARAPMAYESGNRIMLGWMDEQHRAIAVAFHNDVSMLKREQIDNYVEMAHETLLNAVPKPVKPRAAAEERKVERVPRVLKHLGESEFADAVTMLTLDLINDYVLGRKPFPILYIDNGNELCINYEEEDDADIDTGIGADNVEWDAAGKVVAMANEMIRRDIYEYNQVRKDEHDTGTEDTGEPEDYYGESEDHLRWFDRASRESEHDPTIRVPGLRELPSNNAGTGECACG